MLAISGACAVNNPPEYLLKATMRPVVRFSAVGQVNVHPLLVGGLASIWWWTGGQCIGMSPAATRCKVRPGTQRLPRPCPAAMQWAQLQW